MLSENLYKLRRKSGLSQEQLAEKLGVSRQAISKWENGTSSPELDKLTALSEFFCVTIDELTSERKQTDAEDGERETPRVSESPLSGRIGVGLCLLGVLCLLALGVLLLARPDAVRQLSESSVITLNGTGMLIILFVLFMAFGTFLILKKK